MLIKLCSFNVAVSCTFLNTYFFTSHFTLPLLLSLLDFDINSKLLFLKKLSFY